MNAYIQTAALLIMPSILFMIAGLALGGNEGMIVALVFAMGINAFAYWNSDKIVLRMHGAKKAQGQAQPELFDIVSTFAAKAAIPMPSLYIIDEAQPNAFATGRNPKNAAIAVTTGLLGLLSHDELSAVIAHELAHIKNRDTVITTITATIAGTLLLAPLVAMIVQMTISQRREYEADRVGAEITGEPAWLASALGKLENSALAIGSEGIKINPASAQMFIINPLQAHRANSIFSTHPATINRIMRLIFMSAKKDWHRQSANDLAGNSKGTSKRESSIPTTRD